MAAGSLGCNLESLAVEPNVARRSANERDTQVLSPLRFAVFGHPVTHSLSPRIHRSFAEQTGRSLDYDTIDAATLEFTDHLTKFRDAGGYGANITLPHKRSAFFLCDKVSERAQRIGAVNTLTFCDGLTLGDNTDGDGLVRDITVRHRLDVRGRRILLLGAGGAAQAVIYALIDAAAGEVVICNRTPERAAALADRIGDLARIHCRNWNDLAQCGSFDLIVNATSAAHHGTSLNLPFSLAGNCTLCYDLSYADAARDFLSWAHAANAGHIFDGLGMLVEQAAEAFALWHGVRPDTEPVYRQLRSELKPG